MPEIVWKQGAENDLFHTFADLEDRSEGTGERFVQKLDFTLEHLRVHPEIAPLFEARIQKQSAKRSADCSDWATSCYLASERLKQLAHGGGTHGIR